MGYLGGYVISQERINPQKKIIEDWFPIESVGEEGRQEKKISSGTISSIHQWHARRPACAIRAIILTCLFNVTNDNEKYTKIKDFIVQYCRRFIPETITLQDNDSIKKQAKTTNVLDYFLKNRISEGVQTALDPFSGGGTIPFEFTYAGLDTYGSDLNPVAVLINKGTVEYPKIFHGKIKSVLLPGILKYSKEIYDDLVGKFGTFYLNSKYPNEEILSYIWAMHVQCPKSDCGLIIPMAKSLVLDEAKKIALVALIPDDFENKSILFRIGWPEKEELKKGFYKKGNLTCPRCNTTISNKEVHQKFASGIINENIIAIYFETKEGERGYRIASVQDEEIYRKSQKVEPLIKPDLELPKKVWKWVIHNFGLTHSKQLFNDRQYLVACSLTHYLINLYPKIIEEFGEEMGKAIILYLQFGLDRLLDFNSRFSMQHGTRIRSTWARPGLFMTGLYVEANPISNKNYSGSWLKYFSSLSKVLTHLAERPTLHNENIIKIAQMDVQDLDHKDNFFDYIITDPPYYDNVPYAADSDFFYVWERACLNHVFPELYVNDNTPKDEELVADPDLRGGRIKAKQFYEAGMSKAFSEMYRVLKPNGIIVTIFAHKNTAAWETLLQAFIQSKFVVTATWPVPMESRGKLGALTSASLTSVVLVVARRKMRKPAMYFDKNFQTKTTNKIHNRMQEFWNQNLRGADFFMCGIGPSLKYYSKYDAVLDPKTDKPISVSDYLSFIQNILINFAVEQISQTAYSGTLDRITQFYLVWRWGYGLNFLPFDEIKILYQALTIDLNDLEKSILRKKKGKADYECLGPNERFKNIDVKKMDQFAPESMIDYLHFSSYLWEKDERNLLEKTINSALLKFGDALWTIAQALHDVLPECHEQTQLQNLLQRYKKFKPRLVFVPTGEKAKQVQKTLFPKTETENRMTPEGEEEISEDEDTESEESNDEEE